MNISFPTFFLIYPPPLTIVILQIMLSITSRGRIVVTSPTEVPLNAGIPSMLSWWLMSPCRRLATASRKPHSSHTHIRQLKSLESPFSYGAKTCHSLAHPLNLVLPAGTLENESTSLSACHPFNVAGNKHAVLKPSCLTQMVRCLVLLLMEVRKWQPWAEGDSLGFCFVAFDMRGCVGGFHQC